MSGKTTFTNNLIKNVDKLYSKTPQKIIISYSKNREQYIGGDNIEFVNGLDFDLQNISNIPTLIIFDDQMNDVVNNPKIQNLLTKGVHHNNQSVIYITQNIYNQGRFARDVRLNVHYMIIFKSPTFLSQVQCLGRQIFPEHPRFLLSAYKQATEKPFSYLYLSLHPETNDELRVRSGILPQQEEIVFVK